MIYLLECGCGNQWEVDEDLYETRAPASCPDCDQEPRIVSWVNANGEWEHDLDVDQEEEE